MKRKSLRTLVCALLASLALTTFAFADNGPKPQLIVRVKNAPQEPYYLDLLAKGDWDAEDGNSIDGIDWNYDDKENTLDRRLARLRCAGHDRRADVGRAVRGRDGRLWQCTALVRLRRCAEHLPHHPRHRIRQGLGLRYTQSPRSAIVRHGQLVGRYVGGHRFRSLNHPRLLAAICRNARADVSHRGLAAASVPLFVEEKLGSVFTCQRSDTGLFSRCICICHRTQRRERLVSLFLPASGGTHHFACRAVSLRRLRLSHRPQQGPRRGLCDHGQSGFRCSRLLSGRACLAARCLDLVIFC